MGIVIIFYVIPTKKKSALHSFVDSFNGMVFTIIINLFRSHPLPSAVIEHRRISLIDRTQSGFSSKFASSSAVAAQGG